MFFPQLYVHLFRVQFIALIKVVILVCVMPPQLTLGGEERLYNQQNILQ